MTATELTRPTESDRAHYYEAAMRALRFVEQRSPTARRFGKDADTRWAAFRGNLTTADRMDLMLRDADAQWPAAFGARNVFALRAASEVEAFGVEWSPLDPVDAEELFRRVAAEPLPTSVEAALDAAASAWGLALSSFDVGAIQPADKLIVVGPSAIAALVRAFSTGADLDWADQVVCVATPASHRQLAALAGALLNATRPTALLAASRAATPGGARRLLISNDALDIDAQAARAVDGRSNPLAV